MRPEGQRNAGRENRAHGDFLGHEKGDAATRSVNADHIKSHDGGEVQAGNDFRRRQVFCDDERASEDGEDERRGELRAMDLAEFVALLQGYDVRGVAAVEEAIEDVNDPNGEEEQRGVRRGKFSVVGAGEKCVPGDGDEWGVEAKKVRPEPPGKVARWGNGGMDV